MPTRATAPFFARLGPASVVNLVMATALTAIGLMDVLTQPFSTWKAGEVAPVTYRVPAGKRCAFDTLLSVGNQANGEERFLSRKGHPVSQEVLEDLHQQIPERAQLDPVRALGALAFYFLALTFFTLLLMRSGQHLLLRLRAVASLYLVLLLGTLAAKLLFDQTSLSVYAAPAALAVLLFAPLVNQAVALSLHLLAVALLAPMMGFSPGMVLLPLVTGWSAVILLRQGAGVARVLLAALLGALLGSVSMLGLDLFAPHRFDYSLRLEGDLVGLVLGTLGTGLLAALLASPAARLFGAVPRARLGRLQNLDHPVLRDLAEKAPGTFQHTLAVANMAEKVADDIGADATLTRVGAYFHDIGKMSGPEFFSENQQGDNPHERLSPDASAERLRVHIQAGLTIAGGADLPSRVEDFIVEHHGSSVMEYFLDKASRLEGRQPDPVRFSYQGRNPTSRETAVLMLVDSVEAASRTLQQPDREKIEDLVRRIIFGKLLKGYLDDSGLTSRDLKKIGMSLMRILESQFHVRVEYPWQRRDTPPPAVAVEPPRRPLTDPAMRVVQAVPPGEPGPESPAGPEPPAAQPTAEPNAGPGGPPATPTPGSANDHDR
ncbi:MAG TPA: HDIG domain-containing protein [Myxococcota bacterium]|nr:HDIG domain-containing protein [Myxococcota bacterium]HRY97332.1 HDIG domain-containing protein [Myxococcota bacterium]HSA24345.1 HDIG domain-containing protein [Myxococcota bacterium]